jgi:hypothetical protein
VRRYLGPAVVLTTMTAATASVVRFEPWIVATYTLAAVLLALACLRPHPHRPDSNADSRALTVAVAASGLLVLLVPGFTYLRAHAVAPVRLVWVSTAMAAATTTVVSSVVGALVRRRGRRNGTARADVTPMVTLWPPVVVAGLGYLVAAVLILRGDPAPSIDVWYTLQGSADALAAGRNIYHEVWLAPPGVMAAFTYLPWTAVLLAPGRWLAGDVRVGLLALSLGTSVLVAGFGRRGDNEQQRRAAAAAVLVLLLPGTTTQIEQAWTEPALLALLVAAAAAWYAGRSWPAAVLIALALASKQHTWLLLPLLAAWPPIGLRRTVKVAALALLLMSPWLLADARAMTDDTVGLLLRYPPMDFADTWVIAARRGWGWTPSLVVTGPVLLAAVALAIRGLRQPATGLGELARWSALVLLVASLVNKQGFYNQFWLAAALVVVSWAVPDSDDSRDHQAAANAADGDPAAIRMASSEQPAGRPPGSAIPAAQR